MNSLFQGKAAEETGNMQQGRSLRKTGPDIKAQDIGKNDFPPGILS
jgi:hypothetical protein